MIGPTVKHEVARVSSRIDTTSKEAVAAEISPDRLNATPFQSFTWDSADPEGGRAYDRCVAACAGNAGRGDVKPSSARGAAKLS